MKQNKYNLTVKLLMFALILLVSAAATEAKGRKFGLFVGINDYPGNIPKLSGCVNDATKMQAAMAAKFGFNKADTTLLTDADATRENIMNKIKMYEAMAGKDDLFVFHYSGHGTLFPDAYSEEQDETEMQYVAVTNENGETEVYFPRDKYDSAIVPFDTAAATSGKPWENLIIDDELYQMFSAFTKKGAQVVFISDSCHSGSIGRDKLKAQPRFTALHKAFGANSFEDLQLKKPEKTEVVKTPPQFSNLYITLTGAKDNEFSLDAGENGVAMGLFTSTLLKSLTAPNAAKMTYKQLMNAVSPNVATAAQKYNNNQHPQLDARFGNPDKIIFSVPAAAPAKPTSVKKTKKSAKK